MIAKANGKILLFGGYALLEPENVGLVLSVNKFLTAETKQHESVLLKIPQLEIELQGNFHGNRIEFDKVLSDTEIKNGKFAANAIGYALAYLDIKGVARKGVSVVTQSELSKGLGSSSAATVAVVKSILDEYGASYTPEELFKVSYYSHTVSQGGGSGFDIAACIYGNHIFTSFSADIGNFRNFMKSGARPGIEPFKWSLPCTFISGFPVSTKTQIMRYKEFKQSQPLEYRRFMYEYSRMNHDLASAMKQSTDWTNKLIQSWEMRDSLVNIAPEAKTLLNELLSKGYVAGFTGAGGDCVVVLSEDESMKAYVKSKGFEILDIRVL